MKNRVGKSKSQVHTSQKSKPTANDGDEMNRATLERRFRASERAAGRSYTVTSVNLDRAERQQVAQYACLKGISFSKYVRGLIRKDVKRQRFARSQGKRVLKGTHQNR